MMNNYSTEFAKPSEKSLYIIRQIAYSRMFANPKNQYYGNSFSVPVGC